MSFWTSSVIALLLLQVAPSHAQQAQVQQAGTTNEPVLIDVVAVKPEANPLRPLAFEKKDWDLTRAYFDVFSILSNDNPCSSFYGGPRAATTVFNKFAELVKPGAAPA